METVYESKWGFHPCDRETYFLLKRARHLWALSRRRLAAWYRWNRKDEHNRVSRKRLRNAQGMVIGYGEATPISEPLVPDFMVEAKWGYKAITHEWIDKLYFESKQPKSDREEVTPFDADTKQKIVDLLNKLTEWYSFHGKLPKWAKREEAAVQDTVCG